MTRLGKRAAAVSLCAHGVIAFAMGSMKIESRGTTPPAPPRVIWLGDDFVLPYDAPEPIEERSEDDASPAESAPVEPEPIEPRAEPVERLTRVPEEVTPPPDDLSPPADDRPSDIADDMNAGDDAWLEHTRARRTRLQVIDLDIATAIALQHAKDRLAREENVITFSLADLGPREPQATGPARGVFDSGASDRAGMRYRTALGENVRWVSDNCFQTSGTASPTSFPAGKDIYDLPMTNCMSSGPRDDLFEHLKDDRESDEEAGLPR